MKIKQAIFAGSLTLLSLYYTSLQCFARDETQDETDFNPSPYAWLDFANEVKYVMLTSPMPEFSLEAWAVAAVAGLSFSSFSYWADYYTEARQPYFGDRISCSACAYCANTSDIQGHTGYGSYITYSLSLKPPQIYTSVPLSTDGFYYTYGVKLMSNSSVLGTADISWSLVSSYWDLDIVTSDVTRSSGASILSPSISHFYHVDSVPTVPIPPTFINPHSVSYFVPPDINIPTVTSHAGDTPEFILSDIVDNVHKSVPSADLSEITEQIEGIIGASSGDYYDLPAPLFPNPGDQQLLPTMETVDESNATFSSALNGTLWWFQNFKSMFESDFFKQFLPFIILSLIFAVAYLILRW